MTESELADISAALLPFVTMWKAHFTNEEGMIPDHAPVFRTYGTETAELMPADFERAEAALKMVASHAATDALSNILAKSAASRLQDSSFDLEVGNHLAD